MRLEDRIRNELHDTAERLVLDPGEYQRAVAAGQRRRRQQIIGTLSGMVAIAGLVVVVLALRPGGEVVVGPSSTTTPATTAPGPATTALPVASLGAAVVVAGPEGVDWTELGADQSRGQLQSDPYYEAISSVVSDGEGGLIFTHEVTPLPWDQGTLLWLPSGATAPRPVIAPPPEGVITPIQVVDGRIYYLLDWPGLREVRSVNLDGSNEEVAVAPRSGIVAAALVEGSGVVVANSGDCGGFSLSVPAPGWMEDCPRTEVVDLAYADGYLFTLEQGPDGRLLRKTHFNSGEAVVSDLDDGWQIEAIDPSTVAVGGESVVIGNFRGSSFVPETEIEGAATFALVPDLNLRIDASLGSGLGELPCTPIQVPALGAQEVPAPVEAKRQLIFELASGCEMEALAHVVLEDGASFTLGGEEDPIRTWIGSSRSGFDVMSMTVRMLNSDPAIDDSGAYAWPAVHATGAEEDWQALSGILSAAEFEHYYQLRDSGYLGLRIGIDPDGRLAYLIAGD